MGCTVVAPEMFVFSFMVFLFLPVQVSMEDPKYYAQLPSRITALIGSCVQVPCTFDAPENTTMNTQSVFGFWIKKNHAFAQPDSLVVFNGSANIIKGFSHIEILGNLSLRECTTVFYDVMNNHTDKYYFRVEMKPKDWKYTYQYSPIDISVSNVPVLPILTPTNLKDVMEETTVNLSCSAEAPCPKQPPKISWSNIPQSANITTQLQEKLDKTQSVFSYMTFKASYKDHRRNITCTATYPRNTSNDSTVETAVMLRVLFSPKDTDITIDPSDSVPDGTNVTLTCKSKASPNEINYIWYKRGQDQELDFGEQLTFSVNRKSGGWYFCTAKNIHGNQTSKEIQLIVASSSGSSSLIIGCIGGISAFLFIFLLVTIFLRVQRVKASIVRETDVSDQSQETHIQITSIYDNSAFVTSEELEMPKDENEIHYGQIDFSTPQTKSTTVKSLGEETIYAEVCGSGKN